MTIRSIYDYYHTFIGLSVRDALNMTADHFNTTRAIVARALG